MKKQYDVPKNLQPLHTWAYVGYNVLFTLPLIGLICAIVFAIDSTNINRRSYARSILITKIISTILLIAFAILITILMQNLVAYLSNWIDTNLPQEPTPSYPPSASV